MVARILMPLAALVLGSSVVVAQDGPGKLEWNKVSYTFNDQRLFIDDAADAIIHDSSSTPPFIQRSANGTLFSLDLSTTWPTSAPVWSKTAVHPQRNVPSTSYSFNKDGSTLYAFGFMDAYPFDVKTSTWGEPLLGENRPGAAFYTISNMGHTSLKTDSETGLIYGIDQPLVNGSLPTSGDIRMETEIRSFDPTTREMSQLLVTLPWIPQFSYPDGVLINDGNGRKSLFFLAMDDSTVVIREYNIVTKAVTTMESKGELPAGRFGACFVPVEGGLVLVGGARLVNGTIPFDGDLLEINDVYKYEISTSTWSKLTELPSTVSTGYIFPVCAVSGNNLVVLGGFDFRANGTAKVLHKNDGTPIVYDLKQNAWQATYTPTNGKESNGQDQKSGATTTATGAMGAATTSIVVGMMVVITGAFWA